MAPTPPFFSLKNLKFLLEALGVWLVHGILKLLPLDCASSLGGWLGRTIGPRLKKSNRARRNLARFLPELSTEEREKIVISMWDNMGRVAAEYGHLPHIRHDIASRVEIKGIEHLEALRDDDKPGILFSAHLGNWEMATLTALAHKLPLSIIYRPANNPYVNAQVRKSQSTLETTLISKGPQGGRQLISTLTQGGHLFLMVDQKLNDGLLVPFFGAPAMTPPAVGRLAIKYQCPLVPVQVERLQGARFRVTFHPPLKLPTESSSATSDPTLQVMTEVNQVLESWIRANPAQWLWIHQRWPEDAFAAS